MFNVSVWMSTTLDLVADDHEHKDEDLGKEFFHSGTNHVKYFAIGNPHFIHKALF